MWDPVNTCPHAEHGRLGEVTTYTKAGTSPLVVNVRCEILLTAALKQNVDSREVWQCCRSGPRIGLNFVTIIEPAVQPKS